MAVVSVTGNVWDHTGRPIDVSYRPELWFRPNRSNVAGDVLAAGVEVQALVDASGTFIVNLESGPGIRYTPVLRWLTNPSESAPEMWSWGSAEWNWTIHPYPGGGSIGELIDRPDLTPFLSLVSDVLPPGYRGWWLQTSTSLLWSVS